MDYFVYAIKNDDNKIYIGQTDNLPLRLDRHNKILKSKIKSYTSKNKHGDWILFYQEAFPTRQEAVARERQLKSYQGRTYLKNLLK